jgi:hypothetical protein
MAKQAEPAISLRQGSRCGGGLLPCVAERDGTVEGLGYQLTAQN